LAHAWGAEPSITQTSRVVFPFASAAPSFDPHAATADIRAAMPLAAVSLRFTPFLLEPLKWCRPVAESLA
jgi:hypothetical protein